MRRRRWLVGLLASALLLSVGAAATLAIVTRPARLSATIQNALQDQIAGHVELTARWQPPLGLELQGVRIAEAAGQPAVLVIERAAAHIAWGALWRGRVTLVGPTLEGLAIDAASPSHGGAGTALGRALSARNPPVTRPARSLRDVSWLDRVPFSIEQARVLHADVAVLVQSQAWRTGDVSASFGASGTLQAGELWLEVQPSDDDASFALRGVRWARDSDAATLEVASIRTTFPQASGTASLRVAQDERDAVSAAMEGTLDVDVQAPLLRALVAPSSAWAPTGRLQLDVDASASGPAEALSGPDALSTLAARVHLSAHGDNLRVGPVPLSELSCSASLAQGRLTFEDVHLTPRAEQAVRLGGVAWLQRNHRGELEVGAHQLWLEVAQLQAGGVLNGHATLQGDRLSPLACESRLGGALRLTSVPQMPPKAQPVDVQWQAKATGRAVHLEEAQLTLGALGRLTGRARADWGDVYEPLWGELQGALSRITALSRAGGWPIQAESARLHATLGGSRAAPHAHGTLTARKLALASAPLAGALGTLHLPFTLSDQSARIDGATLRGPMGAARLEAQAPWRSGTNKALTGSLRLESVPVPLTDGHVGLASGSAVLMGTLNAPAITGLWRLVSADGLRGHPLDATALVELSPACLQVPGLAARVGADGRLFITGQVGSDHISLGAQARQVPLLPMANQSQALTAGGVPLDVDAHVSRTAGGPMTIDARLRAPQGWLDGHAQGAMAWAGPWQGSVRGRGTLSPLGLILPSWRHARPGGEVSLGMEFAYRRGVPQLAGAMTWQAPRLYGEALLAGDLSLVASTPRSQHVEFVLRGEDERLVSSTLRIDASRPRTPQFALDVRALSLQSLLPPLVARDADLTLSGQANGSVSPNRSLVGRAFVQRAEVHVAEQTLSLEHPVELSKSSQGIAIGDTSLRGSAGRVRARAQLGDHIDAAVHGRLHVDMLGWLLTPLRRASGEVAFDGTALGPQGSPRVQARLDIVRPLAIEAEGLASEVQMAQGRVRLLNERLHLESVQGRIEGGTFAVNAQMHVPALKPGSFVLALTGTRVPLRAGPLLAESNLALHATGDASAMQAHITGDVDIVEGRVNRRFDLRDLHLRARKHVNDVPLERRMPWLHNITLDVHTKNRGGFDVRVDAGSFAMASALECDVHIGGTAMTPRLNGKITATDGSLQFPRGRLLLRQASIEFDPARIHRHNALGTDINVYAQGEVTPSSSSAQQTYDVTLRLDGHPNALQLDLSSSQGMTKMDILSLLTTGHASISELAQGGDEGARLDAALSVAGSQVAGPVARLAERLIERRLNLQIELGSEVSEGNVRVTAAKNLHRRLRLETAYSHGLTAEQSNVSTRAQLSFTDRLLLEGRAARDLTGSSSTVGSDHSVQSNLELKLRLLGH